MSSPSAKSPYAGYRFPPEVISHAVWLYFRFPLSLRMVEEMLAARGCTALGFWDTGLKPTPPERAVEAVAGDTQPG